MLLFQRASSGLSELTSTPSSLHARSRSQSRAGSRSASRGPSMPPPTARSASNAVINGFDVLGSLPTSRPTAFNSAMFTDSPTNSPVTPQLSLASETSPSLTPEQKEEQDLIVVNDEFQRYLREPIASTAPSSETLLEYWEVSLAPLSLISD